MGKTENEYTEKDFLEWKIDFLNEELRCVNMILKEEPDLDAEDRELLEKDVGNIKIWLKGLKGKKESIALEWKLNFLEEHLDSGYMNLESVGDNNFREVLAEEVENIKIWVKELRVEEKSITKSK